MTDSAILITADHLGASYLGPYGNTWLDTPSINQFASCSDVFEFSMADSTDPNQFHRTIHTGRHAAVDVTPTVASSLGSGDPESLGECLRRLNIRTQFLSDESSNDRLDHSSEFLDHFDEVITIESTNEEPVDSLNSTRCFETFATALAALESQPHGGFLWLHFRGLGQVWDAPLDWRQAFHDDEDVSIYESSKPPSLIVDSNTDPDELFRFTMGFAAQVRVFDSCFGFFVENLASLPNWNDSMILLSSTGGFPLGEHGTVGLDRLDSFGETIRTPLIVRRPNQREGMRYRELVQPNDIGLTLRKWFGDPIEDSQQCLGASNLCRDRSLLDTSEFDVAISWDEDQSAIRTPAWFYRRTSDTQKLFAKPDDIWEVNDVANRCQDVCLQLSDWMDSYIEAARNGMPRSSHPGLADMLVEGLE